MKSFLKLFVCLAILAGTGMAQTSTDQATEGTDATTSPVAYVYVARPTHIDGFAAASNGKLTPVPGSPFANIAVNHLSVTPKYLFGSGNNSAIYTFSIGSGGGIKQVASIDTFNYAPEADGAGPIQLDASGSTLYNFSMADDSFLQSYKIEENGELEFLSAVESDHTFDVQEVEPTMIDFIGSNKYSYQTGCDEDQLNPATEGFKRESNGELELVGADDEEPMPPSSAYTYCPFLLATDPTDHVAFVESLWDIAEGQASATEQLATYTANSSGKLTTTSTYKNMPAVGLPFTTTLSISPSGKLLAVGGKGFQIFHFNGADPITHYSGALQTGVTIQELGWDKANHLYALGGGELFVYTVTPTSITEAPGSPYSIPE
ncbi:MAG: hypothetical protein ABSF53_25725, partial [Terracidiphilus sp.]